MRILVTGVAGFLGSHIADAFLEDGHRVIGIDNLFGGSIRNVPKGVMFFKLDLRNYDSIKDLFVGVDVVYHCAATPHEGFSVVSPRLITSNIVEASISTITAALAGDVTRFINMSSMSRYGNQQTPFTEDMEPKPQDPYAIGKVTVERYLENLCKIHGMEYVIAVPHNIIGARQKYDDPFRNVAAIMANRMLRGKQPVIYGDGLQTRCFSPIQDVIGPLKMMASADVNGEIINIGPDKNEITINALAKGLAKIIGFDFKGEYYPDRPQEVKHATCSADKARRLLGYVEQKSLKESLTELVDYIKENDPKDFDYYMEIEIDNHLTPRTWKDKLI